MLPLTQPKQQASGCCGVPLLGKGLPIGVPVPVAPVFLSQERVGAEERFWERRSSPCAVIKAGYLDFVGGQAKWCCGWALVAQIPGQLLKGFLRDHPKNKPVPRVYSAHAWTRKLAFILLSLPPTLTPLLAHAAALCSHGHPPAFWERHGPRRRARWSKSPAQHQARAAMQRAQGG